MRYSVLPGKGVPSQRGKASGLRRGAAGASQAAVARARPGLLEAAQRQQAAGAPGQRLAMAGAPGEQRVIEGEGVGPIARILQYPGEVEIGLRRVGIHRQGFAGRQGGLHRPPLLAAAEGQSALGDGESRRQGSGACRQRGGLAQIAPDLLGKGQARQGLGIGRIDLEGPAIAIGGLVDPPRLGERPGEIAMGHGQPGRQIHRLAQRGDGRGGAPRGHQRQAQIVVQLEALRRMAQPRAQQLDRLDRLALLLQQGGQIDPGHDELALEGKGLAIARRRPRRIAQLLLHDAQVLLGMGGVRLGRERAGDQFPRPLQIAALMGDEAQHVMGHGIFRLIGQKTAIERLGLIQLAQAKRLARIGQGLGPRHPWSSWSTSSAMAREAVRPGDSMPKRLTSCCTPCCAGPWMTKSSGGPPGPWSLGRIPA